MKVLVVVPLTRRWALEMLAKQFAALDTTGLQCDMLIYCDSTDVNVKMVIDMFERYEVVMPYRVAHSKKAAPHEIRLYHRRDRIRDMLTEVQYQIAHTPIYEDRDLLFMVEDDTKIDSDALQRLVKDYKELTAQKVKVGFIEGAQVGRHGIRMIGAWRMDDLNNPTVMSTIPYNRNALFEKIDGGGLYCFITPMKLFLAHTFHWHDECFSVDVTYGIELRKQGYINVIDWSVIAAHIDQHGNIYIPNENCTVARYEKDGDEWKLKAPTKGATS